MAAGKHEMTLFAYYLSLKWQRCVNWRSTRICIRENYVYQKRSIGRNLTMRAWTKTAVMTRILCALAVFALGFSAHATVQPITGPFSAEYQLPDGSFASICLPSGEHGKSDAGINHCSVCLISAAAFLTQPGGDTVFLPALAASTSALPVSASRLNRILSYHRQSRGPPRIA
jgi:hypothetical protein